MRWKRSSSKAESRSMRRIEGFPRRHLLHLFGQASLLGKSLLGKGSALILAARILQNITGLVLSVILVRRFGLAGVGTYALSIAVVTAINLAGTFGLPFSLARSNAPMEEKNTVGVFSCLLLMPITLPVILVYSFLVGHDPEEALIVALFSASGWFFAQTAILHALFVLQGRIHLTIWSPVISAVGVVAVMFTDSLVESAVVLLIIRLLGNVIQCLCLQMAKMPLKLFVEHLSSSVRFLSSDIISSITEQLCSVLVSYILTREEFGLFGLCRQITNVADAPCFSVLQAAYPTVIRSPVENTLAMRRQIVRLGSLATIGFAVLTLPLGLWFYHVPSYPFYATFWLLGLPSRYLCFLYDSGLRALGNTRIMNKLAIFRGLAGLAGVSFALLGLFPLLLGSIANYSLFAVVGQNALIRTGDRNG